jgi:hypothetical protein
VKFPYFLIKFQLPNYFNLSKDFSNFKPYLLHQLTEVKINSFFPSILLVIYKYFIYNIHHFFYYFINFILLTDISLFFPVHFIITIPDLTIQNSFCKFQIIFVNQIFIDFIIVILLKIINIIIFIIILNYYSIKNL